MTDLFQKNKFLISIILASLGIISCICVIITMGFIWSLDSLTNFRDIPINNSCRSNSDIYYKVGKVIDYKYSPNYDGCNTGKCECLGDYPDNISRWNCTKTELACDKPNMTSSTTTQSLGNYVNKCIDKNNKVYENGSRINYSDSNIYDGCNKGNCDCILEKDNQTFSWHCATTKMACIKKQSSASIEDKVTGSKLNFEPISVKINQNTENIQIKVTNNHNFDIATNGNMCATKTFTIYNSDGNILESDNSNQIMCLAIAENLILTKNSSLMIPLQIKDYYKNIDVNKTYLLKAQFGKYNQVNKFGIIDPVSVEYKIKFEK